MISKKKVFSQAETQFFWSKSHQVLYKFSLPIPMKGGRSIFVFSAKIGLRSAKNGVFCILFRPMEEAIAPSPLAMLLSVIRLSCIFLFSMEPKLDNFICKKNLLLVQVPSVLAKSWLCFWSDSLLQTDFSSDQ